MHDVLITGGTVVHGHGLEAADVAIDGERIAALYPRAHAPVAAREMLDATGKLVLPGAIDPHVHYEMVGSHGTVTSERADNSIAAAAGGTTTVVDFVFHEDEPTVHDAIERRRALLDGRMGVDYGLHVLLSGEPDFAILDEIPDIVRAGMPTIKTMTTYRWMVDDGYRFGVMQAVAAAGGMNLIHAEDDALIKWLTRKHEHEGKLHGAYVSATRPALAEELAVRRALLLAERAGASLYVLHVAAADAARAIAEAAARGVRAYGETLIAYLSFTEEDLWDRRPVTIGGREFPDRGLLNNNYPPPKTARDREHLWAALASGELQVVSSDHFLAKGVDRYTKQGTTIHGMQSGQAAVELRVPVLHQLGVIGGRLDLPTFVRLIATNPARLAGLYPRKGVLAPGSDADVLIFDQRRRWTVTVDGLAMDTDYSCWDGWELQGAVDTVLLRGTTIVRDGRIVERSPRGRFVERALAPGLVLPGQR